MLKHLSIFCFLVLALFGLVKLSQGTFVSNQLYPSCINTEYFNNFSYAKGVYNSAGTFACNGIHLSGDPSPPMNITWFYYDTYPVPGPPCGNPALPDGDQCCHTTTDAYSTITLTTTAYVNLLGVVTGTSLGTVTAGTFMGQSASFVLVKTNVLNNCNKPYGQEAAIGTASLTIGSGPDCANGLDVEEYCPGHKSPPLG